MDICIGGILNGKVRKNNENYFSIGNPHSDDVTEVSQAIFPFGWKAFLSFWVCNEINFQEASRIAESFFKKEQSCY